MKFGKTSFFDDTNFKNGPDMASAHRFLYFLLVIHSFSLTNSNFWTKLYKQDF